MIEARLRKAAQNLGSPPAVDLARGADVAYATVDSPFGTFVAAVTNKGLVRLALAPQRIEAVFEDLAARSGVRGGQPHGIEGFEHPPPRAAGEPPVFPLGGDAAGVRGSFPFARRPNGAPSSRRPLRCAFARA
jgi:hypothetical protein